MREALAASQTPLILQQALARKARRRRSRAPLPLIPLPASYQPTLSLPPPPPAYNNYLSKRVQRSGPKGKVGAPIGNRNAEKRLPAHWLALEVRFADLQARAAEAIARAEILIAERAGPVILRDIFHITVIRDGRVVREREITVERIITRPEKRKFLHQTEPRVSAASPATASSLEEAALPQPSRHHRDALGRDGRALSRGRSFAPGDKHLRAAASSARDLECYRQARSRGQPPGQLTPRLGEVHTHFTYPSARWSRPWKTVRIRPGNSCHPLGKSLPGRGAFAGRS